MHACSVILSRLTLCDPMDYPPSSKFLCPWDSPGKNTGVGFQGVSSGDPGDLLNPGIKRTSPASPSRVGRFLSNEPSEKILCRRKWQPTPIFLPGESPGQRRLVGYSSWGLKESDMTEGLHLHKKCPETEYFLILLCERETGVTSLEGQRECKALGKRFLLPAK